MSEMLKKARAYEAEKAAQTDQNTRPLFHISAPAGWINDPNGFSIYDGKIHLFYQYSSSATSCMEKTLKSCSSIVTVRSIVRPQMPESAVSPSISACS